MKRRWTVLTLLLLAPFVGEVMSASTPITDIGGLIFFIPMYGAGALLIRELVWRRKRGWVSIVLLGLAYALIEEGLAVQAIFNPGGVEAASWGLHAGGYVFGVYGMFAVAVCLYHAIWSIAMPIALVDLLFPRVYRKPLLSNRGLVVAAVTYALGVGVVAYIARTIVAPGYAAPVHLLVATAIVTTILVGLGLYLLPRVRTAARDRIFAPRLWQVGLFGILAGFVFMSFFTMPVQYMPQFTKDAWPLVPLFGASLILLSVYFTLRRWSRSSDWSKAHELCFVGGVIFANPLVALTQSFELALVNRVGLMVIEALLLSLVIIRIRQINRSSVHR